MFSNARRERRVESLGFDEFEEFSRSSDIAIIQIVYFARSRFVSWFLSD